MTAFTLINGALLATIIVWVVWPLLRETTAEGAGHRRQRRVFAVALSMLMPTLALAVYSALGGTDFGSPRRHARAEAGMGGRSEHLPGGPVARPAASRSVRVAVSIAPHIQKQISSPLPLFIFARDPAGGPPLAVQRHRSDQAPLAVELSDKDAMMPARSIASVSRVQIVARVSKAGTPLAQRGDFFGAAEHEFVADQAAGQVRILIDRIVQ